MRALCGLVLCVGMLAATAAGQQPAQITCKGTVLDADGAPLAGVAVSAYELISDYASGTFALKGLGEAATKADGAFQFQAASSGNLAIIVAAKEGLVLGWANWRLFGGDLEATIRLGKASVLAGVVVDESGAAIAGAEVRAFLFSGDPQREQWICGLDPIDALVARSDAKGRFALNNVPADCRAEFLAAAPGRARLFTMQGRPAPGQFAAGKTDIRIVLSAEARIEGLVLQKATRKPVAGVRIIARPVETERPPFEAPAAVASAEDGSFRITGLCQAGYHLQLAGRKDATDEWVAAPVTVATEAGKTNSDVTIELSKGGIVEVVVTDAASGKPIEGARVSLRNPEYRQHTYQLTGKDGAARLRVLPGRYDLISVYLEGYATPQLDEAVSVAEGQTQRLSVRLKELSKITGVVRDTEGKVVDGAVVCVLPGMREQAETDAEGRFQAAHDVSSMSFDPVSYLVARHEGRNLAAAVEIEQESKPIEVRLAPGWTIAGQVADADGKPVHQARVMLMLQASRWGAPISRQPLATDAGGRYAIKAVPADHKYMLYVSADGYGEAQLQVPTDQAKDNHIEVQTIVLKLANLSVSGVVVDLDGEPIGGVQVQASGEGQPGRQATTDASGNFTIENICAGKVRLYARIEGASSSSSIVTEAGAKDVKITLESPPKEPASLVGKPLGNLQDFRIVPPPEDAAGKRILVCFWDYQQRPSRHCISALAGKARELQAAGAVLVSVQAGEADEKTVQDWLKDSGLVAAWGAGSLPAGAVPGDEKARAKTLRGWGVQGLPWLILTDRKHIVRAEGFRVAELDDKLKQLAEE